MKKAMLFSGGYDSTYLLNDLMKKEDELTIVSITSNLLVNEKVKREEKARERILNYLKAKYYNCTVTELKGEINLNNVAPGYGLSQPLLWLPFMQLLIDGGYELNFSYICDDQATTHIDDFKKILEITFNFRHDGEKLNINFPLRYFYKRDIISRLVHEDKFLFENATSCEGWNNEEDFCGECIPCKCLRSTLIDLICDEEVSIEDKDYYRGFLADKFKTKIVCETYKPEIINIEDECNIVANNDCKKEDN